jgi:hypothetical protein
MILPVLLFVVVVLVLLGVWRAGAYTDRQHVYREELRVECERREVERRAGIVP